MSPAANERRYIRAVERAWSKILGSPGVVSPREFEAIDGWRRRGIPLAVVLEVFADFGHRHAGNSPKSLTALARAVESAWSVVAAGRAAPPVAETRTPRSASRRAWEEALGRCPEAAPLHALLTRLLADEADGTAAPALDAALDASLPDAVPEAVRASAHGETLRALEGFRSRMSDEEFQRTFARALADRLRDTLRLPRLALTHPESSRK